MELREFYEKVGGDFDDTVRRLMKESLVKKFVKKFITDPSYDSLVKHLDKGEYEDAFRAVHTLKGVSINLGFQKLYEVSSELTEALRHNELDGIDNMLAAVKKEYDYTIELINKVED